MVNNANLETIAENRQMFLSDKCTLATIDLLAITRI